MSERDVVRIFRSEADRRPEPGDRNINNPGLGRLADEAEELPVAEWQNAASPQLWFVLQQTGTTILTSHYLPS